ncbi:MAG: hypothetical protein HYS86_05095 [Candidatus Chisholmbacteria bacterium]|nr:hypothetical protein [Candidatus Chisholmbacteria bacterium]
MSTLAFELGDAFKLQGGKSIGNIDAFQSPRAFIAAILPNAFILAGLILLILLIGGGITMITQAGNPEAQQKSKGVVTAAVLGFVIIIAAYWIIQILQVLTGVGILRD